MSKEILDENILEGIEMPFISNEEEKIILDKNTNDILKEELFENFDEKDHKGENKIIKLKDKLFNKKKGKMLNAHIIVNVCKNAIVLMACIIIPMLIYLLCGVDKFMKYLPIICLYEIVLLTIYVIGSIMSTKGISSS